MEKLSVVIITFNEEKNIKRCLESVQDIADEIIVSDSFSTDRTEEICREFDVKFHQKAWLGYSAQKNEAVSLTSNNLVFSMDADEALSDKLKKSIADIKLSAKSNSAYKVKRLTNYCGSWIRHCGWYPDTKLRIWFKNEGSWKGELHEEVVFKNMPKTQILEGDLLHYSYYSIQQHISQINTFTTIGAAEAFKKGKSSNIAVAIIKSLWKFMRDYFINLGVLDGYYGFVICSLSAQATFIKYLKLRELKKSRQ